MVRSFTAISQLLVPIYVTKLLPTAFIKINYNHNKFGDKKGFICHMCWIWEAKAGARSKAWRERSQVKDRKTMLLTNGVTKVREYKVNMLYRQNKYRKKLRSPWHDISNGVVVSADYPTQTPSNTHYTQ